MVGKTSYEEIIADHIKQIVEERQIEHVLHFTRLENLATILEHGLLPRSQLVRAEFNVHASDVDRLDENDDAVSVSISCYYPKMFEAKRHRAGIASWSILMLHPSILWNYHCLFYRKGAATNATNNESGKRYGGFALEKLFDDCSTGANSTNAGFRAKYGLPSSWPTFPDSEVQVMRLVHPDFITGACVETPDQGDFVRTVSHAAGREDFGLGVGPFEPRICCKPYYWG